MTLAYDSSLFGVVNGWESLQLRPVGDRDIDADRHHPFLVTCIQATRIS